MRAITETVQHAVCTAGADDRHGNASKTWAAPVPVGVYAFDPGSTSEPREPGLNRVIVEPTVYLPPDVVFAPDDRVTARGKVYEVEGDTREWRHTDGTLRGNVATLRRADG